MSASATISRFASFCSQQRLTLKKLALKRCCSHSQRCSSTASTAPVKARTWQLHSAVCLQRHPVVSAESNEFEKKYKAYLEEIEIRSSLLSDHELQHIADKKRKEKEKKGPKEGKISGVTETLLTADELEDEWQKEIDQFKLASRVTEADKSNDTTSPERKLERKLVLITKKKFSKDKEPVWIFPQVKHEEGESMRQAAERALTATCGDSLNARYLGNAPCGFLKYKLPPGQDEFGVKLFFFKANYHGGSVKLNKEEVLEHKWVTLDELPQYFDEEYLKDVQTFLVEI